MAKELRSSYFLLLLVCIFQQSMPAPQMNWRDGTGDDTNFTGAPTASATLTRFRMNWTDGPGDDMNITEAPTVSTTFTSTLTYSVTAGQTHYIKPVTDATDINETTVDWDQDFLDSIKEKVIIIVGCIIAVGFIIGLIVGVVLYLRRIHRFSRSPPPSNREIGLPLPPLDLLPYATGESSVISPPKWEWQGDDDTWHAYDNNHCKEFERAWKIDNTRDIQFNVNRINYVLHLGSMVQENTDTHKMRDVRTDLEEEKPSSLPQWEWLDEDNTWHAYNKKHCDKFERAWTINNIQDVQFYTHGFEYVLHLSSMEQENTSTHKRRAVNRKNKKQKQRGGYELVDPPDTWKSSKEMLLTSIYIKVQLDFTSPQLAPTSDEFKHVQTMFNATLADVVIKSVDRIENIQQYDKYTREKIRKGPPAQTGQVKELILFHGTDDKNVDGICAQGFDWRLNGANATVFGKGSYFARDASYSKRYSTHSMFLADVIVGNYTQGNSRLLRPPPHKDDKDKLYDSVVDTIDDPAIYVVFETCQAYPTWLIQY